MKLPVCTLPALRQRELLRSGRMTAEELTRLCLSRIRLLDGPDGLNTVCEADPGAPDTARALDRSGLTGPLSGLTVLVKDNIDVAGLHTAAGSFALEDNLARSDAPVITSLREAGAVILGKTNMTEFANFTAPGMPGGFSSRGGQVKHAYQPGRDPMGSSTGSAVAVSAGLCSFALGTDTSFSVVLCGAEHGLCGFKPAPGTLSGRGVVPLSTTHDSVGVLARTVEDAVLARSVLDGCSPAALSPLPLSKMRVLVNTAGREQCSSRQKRLLRDLIARLKKEGASVTETCQPPSPHQFKIMLGEFKRDLEQYLSASSASRRTLAEIVEACREHPEKMPCGFGLLEKSLATSEHPEELEAALREREKARAELLPELQKYDFCLITGPTNICHFIGVSSVSVPAGMWRSGLPRYLLLYGENEERMLRGALALAALYRPVLPPLCARTAVSGEQML